MIEFNPFLEPTFNFLVAEDAHGVDKFALAILGLYNDFLSIRFEEHINNPSSIALVKNLILVMHYVV